VAPLGLPRPPLPPIYPAEKLGPVRQLSGSGNRLSRYGVAAQALKGPSLHPLRLDLDRQRKGLTL
jgi:hypothetical protein